MKAIKVTSSLATGGMLRSLLTTSYRDVNTVSTTYLKNAPITYSFVGDRLR